ncbi:fimbria/pilus outer membrane usher protein [Salinicola socius]|uniref:PapC-like C-terminal domain-containing protein n=1 Tax=Salinicola socius TaxID=404433 RepID=A0A1Q8SU28_9GAMM|nr:fimbria/pilus outer membrane usher protein [Salinicola socius]OLO04931.1 hypothetical protein BTW07_06830 [Salinicola socius]
MCSTPRLGLLLLSVATDPSAALADQGLPPPPTALATQTDTSESLYLELIVNTRSTARVVSVRKQGEHFWVEREALGGMALPSALGDASEVDLAALDRAKLRYDAVNQRLYLDVPGAWLPPQMLAGRPAPSVEPARSTPGALINYDLYTSRVDTGRTRTSLWHELRVFGIGGAFSSTGRFRYQLWDTPSGESDDGYIRYDTTWRSFDQDSLRTLEVGDVITRPLAWTRAVRLGGLQLSRDFSIRPDLVTYPLPAFAGSTEVPTTVDLLIDGNRIDRQDIAPGPFTFADISTLNGAGEATIVTRDASGQRVVTTLPFYVTNELLRPGLSSYSIGAGALREDYAQRNFGYGQAAADASYRYGVLDWLTLGTHAETAESLALGGAGSTLRLWRLGTLELALQHSDARRSGNAWSAGYEYRGSTFSVGARWEERESGFSDLSRLAADDFHDGAEQRGQVTASASLGEWGSVAAGYFDIRGDDYTSRLLNLSYQRSLGAGAQLALTASREPGESWAGLAQLTFSLPGTGGVASVGTYRDATGEVREQARYARSAPLDGGWGWNLGVERGDDQGGGSRLDGQAEIQYRHRLATLRGGYYEFDDSAYYFAGVGGSVALMESRLFAANEIRDAFVVVSTDGHGNIPVRYENQRVGTTDDDGYLLVPWGNAWYPGKYAINTLSLPPNMATSDVEQSVAVQSQSGYLLNFPLERHAATHVKLVDGSGEALPVGTPISIPGGGSSIVGWDGMAYFESLTAATAVVARLPQDGRCRAMIPVEIEKDVLYQPGAVTCYSITASSVSSDAGNEEPTKPADVLPPTADTLSVSGPSRSPAPSNWRTAVEVRP